MKRRDFIQLGAMTLFLAGCDTKYFQASPYETLTDERDLTNSNLVLINNLSNNTKSSFTFPVVSDTHYFYEEFNKVQDTIKKRGSDYSFLLHAGDMTDSGLKWEYERSVEILKRASLPFLTVVGNHDAITNGREIYKRLFGAYDYSTEFNGARLIFFNNNSWEFGSGTPDFNWLESELAKTDANQPIIIICHVPPLQKERFSQEQIDKFRKFVADYNVDFIINGHNHSHEVEILDGVTYLTVGTVGDNFYCEISVTYKEGGDYSVSYTPVHI